MIKILAFIALITLAASQGKPPATTNSDAPKVELKSYFDTELFIKLDGEVQNSSAILQAAIAKNRPIIAALLSKPEEIKDKLGDEVAPRDYSADILAVNVTTLIRLRDLEGRVRSYLENVSSDAIPRLSREFRCFNLERLSIVYNRIAEIELKVLLQKVFEELAAGGLAGGMELTAEKIAAIVLNKDKWQNLLTNFKAHEEVKEMYKALATQYRGELNKCRMDLVNDAAIQESVARDTADNIVEKIGSSGEDRKRGRFTMELLSSVRTLFAGRGLATQIVGVQVSNITVTENGVKINVNFHVTEGEGVEDALKKAVEFVVRGTVRALRVSVERQGRVGGVLMLVVNVDVGAKTLEAIRNVDLDAAITRAQLNESDIEGAKASFEMFIEKAREEVDKQATALKTELETSLSTEKPKVMSAEQMLENATMELKTKTDESNQKRAEFQRKLEEAMSDSKSRTLAALMAQKAAIEAQIQSLGERVHRALAERAAAAKASAEIGIELLGLYQSRKANVDGEQNETIDESINAKEEAAKAAAIAKLAAERAAEELSKVNDKVKMDYEKRIAAVVSKAKEVTGEVTTNVTRFLGEVSNAADKVKSEIKELAKLLNEKINDVMPELTKQELVVKFKLTFNIKIDAGETSEILLAKYKKFAIILLGTVSGNADAVVEINATTPKKRQQNTDLEYTGTIDPAAAPQPSAQNSGGQTPQGAPQSGQTSAGQTSAGQTSAGQTSAGQTSAGQPSAPQPSAGQTSAGQTSAGQTSAGQTSSQVNPQANPQANLPSKSYGEALSFSLFLIALVAVVFI